MSGRVTQRNIIGGFTPSDVGHLGVGMVKITQYMTREHHVGAIVPICEGDTVRPYRITEDHGDLQYTMVPADDHDNPVMRAAAVLLSSLPDVDSSDYYEGYARGVLALGAAVLYPDMRLTSATAHFADQLSRYPATST